MSTWLNPEQAAEASGFSTKTIYRALWSGELAASKRRRRWRIRADALEQWIEGESRVDVPISVPSRARARESHRTPPRGSLGSLLAAQDGDAA